MVWRTDFGLRTPELGFERQLRSWELKNGVENFEELNSSTPEESKNLKEFNSSTPEEMKILKELDSPTPEESKILKEFNSSTPEEFKNLGS